MLDRTFSVGGEILRRRWLSLLLAVAPMVLLFGMFYVGWFAASFLVLPTLDEAVVESWFDDEFLAAPVPWIAAAIGLVLGFWYAGSLLMLLVLRRAVSEERWPATITFCVRRAFKLMASTFVLGTPTYLLGGAAVAAGLLLEGGLRLLGLPLMVLAIIAWLPAALLMQMVSPALAAGARGFGIGSAWRVYRGEFWPVVGIMLILWVIPVAGGMIPVLGLAAYAPWAAYIMALYLVAGGEHAPDIEVPEPRPKVVTPPPG